MHDSHTWSWAFRLPFVLLLLPVVTFLPGCESDGGYQPPVPEHRVAAVTVPIDAWEGLLHPVAITSDPEGRVYIADRGDRTVKVFGPDGDPAGRFGGGGSGPGELTDVESVVALGGEVVVSDPQSLRFVRFDTDGRFLGHIPNEANTSALGGLGANRVIGAGSPLWAMHALMDETSSPLFEIFDLEEEVGVSGGDRHGADNPFVGHIRNFVLPAGARDGTFVWLAQLNHTSVIRHALAGEEHITVERTVPFEWQALRSDFEPSPEFMAQGGNTAPPFDAISLSIVTDASDRAFVLTALSPTTSSSVGRSSPVGIDVLDPREGWTDRILLPESGTGLTVSPDGSRLYLLDESTTRVHVYEWADDG